MPKTIIRPATAADIETLVDIGEAMHRESPRFSRLSYSRAKVAGLLAFLIDEPLGFLRVAEREGVLVGGIACQAAEHWFSEDKFSTDYALFILPEHRGGMTAPRLIGAYIAWAKEQGAKLIQLGVSTGVQTGETVELYRNIGLKQYGYGFEV